MDRILCIPELPDIWTPQWARAFATRLAQCTFLLYSIRYAGDDHAARRQTRKAPKADQEH